MSEQVVLIVEDDQILRTVCKDRLIQAGYTVREAVDGASGLQIALDTQPDIVLLDIRMPNMTGFEMLKKLRSKNDWGMRVPVIFFTNIQPSSDDEMADVEGLGPVAYMIKSDTNLEDIVAKVKEILG